VIYATSTTKALMTSELSMSMFSNKADYDAAQLAQLMPSDNEIDQLLAEINQITEDYGADTFDPPTHKEIRLQYMRSQVNWFFVRWSLAIDAQLPVKPVQVLTDDIAEMIELSLHRAWNLGQTYWRQADSDYISNHKRAEVTQKAFNQLRLEVAAVIAKQAEKSHGL
jgi:hypothetical protein